MAQISGHSNDESLADGTKHEDVTIKQVYTSLEELELKMIKSVESVAISEAS